MTDNEQKVTNNQPYSVLAFNQMLHKFLEDLTRVFGHEKQLVYVHKHFWKYVDRNPTLPQKWFDDSLGKHGDLIAAKNPQLFELCPKVFHGVDINAIWKKASEENKHVMWQYLQYLHQYSSIVKALSPEQMGQVNQMVDSMMQNLSGKQTGETPPDVMEMAMSMMGGGGGGGAAALLAGLLPGASPKQPANEAG